MEIRALSVAGAGVSDLAKQFNLTVGHVNRIIDRSRWGWVEDKQENPGALERRGLTQKSILDHMSIANETRELQPTNCVWAVDALAYHADTSRVGRSMLDCFRDSPRRYHGLYVTGELPLPEPTEAMQFGTLFHRYILEPEKFKATTYIAPQFGPGGERWNRSKKEHKAAWADVLLECNGRTLLDVETADLLAAMKSGIERSPVASALLFSEGPVEQALTWIDEDTGLPCKCLRDKVSGGHSLIVDLKTCEDSTPSAFARHAASYGYHNQSAFYTEGHRQVFNEDPAGFVFVAVSKKAPHDVSVFELDYDAIELGHKQNKAALAGIANCMATGEWSAPHERLITQISLPKYSFQDWSLQ